MPLALSVAKEFTKLSLNGEEPDPLTNMRLQKLLYYAQAWSMVVRGTDLFPEELQAWRLGPVVPVVYKHCKNNEANPGIASCLPSQSQEKYRLLPLDDFEGIPDVSASIADFLANVWESYKFHSALALHKQTHTESPWLNAWGDRAKEETSNQRIEPDAMIRYFDSVVKPDAIERYSLAEEQREVAAREQLDALPRIDKSKFRQYAVSVSSSLNN